MRDRIRVPPVILSGPEIFFGKRSLRKFSGDFFGRTF